MRALSPTLRLSVFALLGVMATGCMSERARLLKLAQQYELKAVETKGRRELDLCVEFYRDYYRVIREDPKDPQNIKLVPSIRLRHSWEPHIARLREYNNRVGETMDIIELRRRAKRRDATAQYFLAQRYDPNAAFRRTYVPYFKPHALTQPYRGCKPNIREAIELYRDVALRNEFWSGYAGDCLAVLLADNPRFFQKSFDPGILSRKAKIRGLIRRLSENQPVEVQDKIIDFGYAAMEQLIDALEDPLRGRWAHECLVFITKQRLDHNKNLWIYWRDNYGKDTPGLFFAPPPPKKKIRRFGRGETPHYKVPDDLVRPKSLAERRAAKS